MLYNETAVAALLSGSSQEKHFHRHVLNQLFARSTYQMLFPPEFRRVGFASWCGAHRDNVLTYCLCFS
jgi:hypothetical protein